MNNASQWQNETNGPKRPGKTWLNALFVFAFFPTLLSSQTEVSADTFLEPYRSIEKSSNEIGQIKQILIKEGDYVKTGQSLIALNSEVITAQYEVAKAKAESQGRIMAAKAERDQQSHRYSLISGIGANSAERKKEYAILQTKEGNLIAAQEDSKINRLEALRIRAEINKRVLKSPIEGHIVEITKDIGESVGRSGGDPNTPDYLVRIVQLSTLKATAFLPYKAVRHIKVGHSLTVASSEVDEEWETIGIVEFVSPIIDPATGTVAIRVTIKNHDLTHKSGVPAKVVVKVPVDRRSKSKSN